MQRQYFFITLFFILLASPVFSQEGYEQQSEIEQTAESDSSNVINLIEITGLKRTKPNIAKYPFEKFLGQNRSSFDENEIFAVIKNTGVLEPVSAELIESDDGLVLHITVLEKWSIFPVPLFFAGSGETLFGLFLYDANALGIFDSFALGGMYSSNGWSAIAMYNHSPNNKELPGWNAFFMYGNHKVENVNNKEKTLREYSTDRLSISLGLNYSFTDIIKSSASFSFTNIMLNKDDAYNAPEEEAMLIGINPRISMRRSSWDGFFLSEETITLEYSYNYAIIGSSYNQIEYRANYEKSLIPGFRFNIRSGGVWKSTDDPLFEEGPGTAQVNILPRNYSAMHYAGLSAGLEKYIVKLKWGTLSVLALWQGVFSGNDIADLKFDHGPSGGMVFYLSRIALPAIGTSLSYNMVSGLYQFSFSVGMAF